MDTTDIGDTANALRKTPFWELELELECPPQQENGNSCCETTKGKEGDGSRCLVCIKEDHFTIFNITFMLSGMILYVADIVTDLLVGVQYFRSDHYLWSIMTFIFVLIPSLVLQYFSFRWFVSDLEKDSDHKKKGWAGKLVCWCDWLATHVLQLGALKRYWRTLKFGLQSRKEKKYYRLVICEYLDITMLRLLEAFMESAPQLVLQVYIMVETEELYWLTAACALVSLSSLAWALEGYHKALRDSCTDGNSITYLALALRMAWRLFTITSRVIAMALFAAIYEWWIFVVGGVHWLVITVWLVWQETTFCDTKFEEVLFDCVMGFIHIFCFFNVKEGATRYRALLFYTVIFVENTVMFGLWYSYQESQEQIYGLPALVFVWGGFFLGIFLMVFYYRFCHPKGQLPYCISPTCGGESPDTVTSDKGDDTHAFRTGANDQKHQTIVMEQPPYLKTELLELQPVNVDHNKTNHQLRGEDEEDEGDEGDGIISPRAHIDDLTHEVRILNQLPRRVNLFSYKYRRYIYPHLLLRPQHRIASRIVHEPPRSFQEPAPKAEPEIMDTGAVHVANDPVTMQPVSSV
ncbi:XK-related protein 6-like [Diadema antillarum]|uniref:XK-related protein 6-like n=1 Tax=Diadema antillarum TaxID=105358 RepID=UPI003A8AF728